VTKHTGSDPARLRLSHPDSRLCVVVEDDNRGFESNAARSGGLANIRDRVGALHGHHMRASRPPAQSARNTPGSVPWCCRSTQMRAMPGRSSMTAPAGLAYLLKDRVGYLEALVPALNEVTSGGSVVDPLIIDPSWHDSRHGPRARSAH
jgi:hypothetical protein